MNFSRANAGHIVIAPTSLDIKSLIYRMCKEQDKLAGRPRCLMDIERLPDRISGDAVLLEQTIGIVLANALRYSPEESRVIVSATRTEKDVTISIEDRGIGIMAKDLPFITQPFFRGANAKHLAGTGIGLSLASHIAVLHSGHLLIESREGAGTTVRIKLPR